MKRREFLKAMGVPALAGIGVNTLMSELQTSRAAGYDYKALVLHFSLLVVMTGHNSLVPTDAAYNDYNNARPILAFAEGFLNCSKWYQRWTYFRPASRISAFSTLYNQQRLAWIGMLDL